MKLVTASQRPSPAGSRRLGDLLVEARKITKAQLAIALQLQQKRGKKLGEILIEEVMVRPEDVAMVLSTQLNIPIIDLKKRRPSLEALKLVPEEMALKYSALPVDIVGDSLVVVMADPEDIRAIDDLRAHTKMRVQPATALEGAARDSIERHYSAAGGIREQVTKLGALGQLAERVGDGKPGEGSVTQLVDLLLNDAVRQRASDIHIEAQGDRTRIRYRIDGILHDLASLSPRCHAQLVSRVKIMAKMNIAERRRPQDGQFSLRSSDKDIDVRVASIETSYGEMVVLRVLDKSLSLRNLSELGFQPQVLEQYRRLVSSPFGLVLVGGPTGSGKTTTLYASLNQLDRTERNIVTVEDPIEYRFADINQIQANPKADITFANGLRAIMRLDPDVIMVGEIRDNETAKAAVQAALTGHLVLSSIHANDAVGVLFRLLDLEVEAFLVSSALLGVASQRMVRRICQHCRVPTKPTPEEQAAYQEVMGEPLVEAFKGEGCGLCGDTGYYGRTGVFEVMTISEEIRRLLLKNANTDALKSLAIAQGMLTMRRDSMMKAKQGITTPSEVLRHVFSTA